MVETREALGLSAAFSGASGSITTRGTGRRRSICSRCSTSPSRMRTCTSTVSPTSNAARKMRLNAPDEPVVMTTSSALMSGMRSAQRAVELDPGNPNSWDSLGWTQLRLGDATFADAWTISQGWFDKRGIKPGTKISGAPFRP